MRTTTKLGTSLVAVLLALGCGDSSNNPPATTATTSTSQGGTGGGGTGGDGGGQTGGEGGQGGQGGQELVIDSLEGGVEGYALNAVIEEAYWYSRYNLGELVMKSGLGETFMPDPGMPPMLVQMVSDDLSTAMPPKNPALLKRVANAGNPSWVNPSDGDPMDFMDGRWGPPTDPGTSTAAAGWTMIKELEWSKQFHVDNHFGVPGKNDIPGAQERFAGLVLYAEALMQALEMMQNPGAFDMSDVGGNHVMLAALSDLAMLTLAPKTAHSEGNRMRMVGDMMAKNMLKLKDADELGAMILGQADMLYAGAGEPKSLRDRSHAIVGLAWYAAASAKNRAEAKKKIVEHGDAILAATKSNGVEHAVALRGLLEAWRVSKEARFEDGAKASFVAMAGEYQGKVGAFKGVTKYQSDDIAWVVGSLGAMLTYGPDVHFDNAEKMLVGFFEASINLAALQVSAPPISSIAEYEHLEQELFHRYPTLPMPPKAGGQNGIAPVTAAEAIFDPASGKWSADKTKFAAAGAMHLANVQLWMHADQVSGYPEVP